ncbi:MAG: PAS domain-containing protein [Bacteroidota bacterium]
MKLNRKAKKLPAKKLFLTLFPLAFIIVYLFTIDDFLLIRNQSFNKELLTHSAIYDWANSGSNALIFIAFLTISSILIINNRRNENLIFRGLLFWFAALIFFCGITYLVDVLIYWEPYHALGTLFKTLTAIISLMTLVALIKIPDKEVDLNDFTKLRNELESVRKEKAMLEMIVSGSNNGIWHWEDIKSDAQWWSPEFYEKLGYADNEVKASLENLKHFIQSDFMEPFTEALNNHFEHNTAFQLDLKLRVKSGEHKWFKIQGCSIRDEDSNSIRMAGSISNIEKVKRLEESLRLKNDTLEGIMDMASIGTWEVDLEMKSVDWSKKVYEIHEIQEGTELFLDQAINCYHYDYRPLINAAVIRAIETGNSWDMESLIITSSKKEVWVRSLGFPVYEGHKLIKLRGLFQKIDEKKKAQEEAEKKEKVLRHIVKHAPAGIAILNNDLNYVYVSDQWYKNYSIRDKDILGKNHLRVFSKLKDMPASKNIYNECLQGKAYHKNKELFFKEDGSRIWLRYNLYPWYNEQDVIGGIVIFTEDISNRAGS